MKFRNLKNLATVGGNIGPAGRSATGAILYACGLLAAFLVPLYTYAQTTDCYDVANPGRALRHIREAQLSQPRLTAECFIKKLNEIPDAITDADRDTWSSYLSEGADLLRAVYSKSKKGSEAQRQYLNAEIRTRILYRKRLSTWLARLSQVRDSVLVSDLQTRYEVSVNYESTAIWLKARELDNEGLDELDRTLAALNPMHFDDDTGSRWIEAVRSCPQWIPSVKKTVPDYKASWCPSSCSANFARLTGRIEKWAKTRSEEASIRTIDGLNRMKSDIASNCSK